MKLTIIPDDSMVMVDGIGRNLDLTTCNIPVEVHALQWFDTKGWVEFDEPGDPFAPKPPNEMIDVLPQWAEACVAVWNAYVPPAPPPPPESPIAEPVT